ncbi:glycosyltransferase family 2 protein [Gonapodya prolifera JEL478]|uniref:chitin synthase n=1 Tax=Gonapodya prolifera (strain JEL478) TaxID=1344416 RepID=A0A139AC65_GONPJ|nr:glycosyltransferase family 2 protein [Gonapodya prolifera JEL478]|eukprot:KXS14401.1 glycosyltransferase family 2 protein [Gonapodya prolifera JEL478]
MSYEPFLSDEPVQQTSPVRRTAGTVRQMLDPRAVFNKVFGGEGGFEALPTSESGGFGRRGATRSGGGIRGRSERKTLTKPLRATQRHTTVRKKLIERTDIFKGPWPTFSRIITICCPNFLLSSIGGMKDYRVRQAWREKVGLCFIVFLISCLIVFFTLALKELLCSTAKQTAIQRSSVSVETFDTLVIAGQLYNRSTVLPEFSHMFENLPPGFSVSDQFTETPAPSCASLPDNLINNAVVQQHNPCYSQGGCVPLDYVTSTFNLTVVGSPVYDWGYLYRQAPRIQNLIVLNDAVLDLTTYFSANPTPDLTNPLDVALRAAVSIRDATILQRTIPELRTAAQCLVEKYGVGKTAMQDVGCLAVTLVFYVGLILVMGVVFTRFAFAVIFDWFISFRLAREPHPDSLALREHDYAHAPVPLLREIGGAIELGPVKGGAGNGYAGAPEADPLEPFVVMLVTAYSEGTESLENTFDSMAATDYHDARKLLLVVADGIVQGKGNPAPTPDLVLELMDQDRSFGEPKPYSYVAVASGSKQHNMARVYVGYYRKRGRNVPTVLVAKCGTPEESGGGKPGNRGKRDSQLVLMNFFRRCILGERMTPLDFDLFRKIHHVMHITPDKFEIVLMVDADTKVHTDSIKLMTRAMINDQQIMGLCGETKITNKTQSWVTAIQVFEYYISHHLGKSFESVFGGVTCLPGCFCMYRIKAYKDGVWVPVLVSPDIVDQYSTNETDTLHQKNLLLLGEDRFLSTLMLRQFPNRKMIFVPRAVCKTTVPDDFQTLLSQRRRWINSTVHNLMELVLVNNLCGTFCFSMQFVVFLDLMGTAILPVSTVMLYYLIVQAIIMLRSALALSPVQIFPLVMMVVSLLIPSFLVLITAKRISYLGWFLLFMLALPIWQIILPLYAFWHFDDFSWGATRQVAGAGGDDHGAGEGEFDQRAVPFKRWEEYEKAWRQSLLNKRGIAPSKGGSDATLQELPSPTGPMRKIPKPRPSAEYVQSYNDAKENEEFLSDDETSGLTSNAAAFGRHQGKRDFRGAKPSSAMEPATVSRSVSGPPPPTMAPPPPPVSAPPPQAIPSISVSMAPPRSSSVHNTPPAAAAPAQPEALAPLNPPLLTFTPPSPNLGPQASPYQSASATTATPPQRGSSGRGPAPSVPSGSGSPVVVNPPPRTSTVSASVIPTSAPKQSPAGPPPPPKSSPPQTLTQLKSPTSPTGFGISIDELMSDITGPSAPSGRPSPPAVSAAKTKSQPSAAPGAQAKPSGGTGSGAIDDLMKGW